MRKVIGFLILSSPFIGMTVYMIKDSDVVTALKVWCVLIFFVAIMALGAYLSFS